MIKITKNILSDTISFDLAIKLKSIDLYRVEAEIRVKTGNLMDTFYIKLPVYYFRTPLLFYKRYYFLN